MGAEKSKRQVGNCAVCDLEVVVTAKGDAFRHDRQGFSLYGTCDGSRQPAVNVQRERIERVKPAAKRAPKGGGIDDLVDGLNAISGLIDGIL